MPGKQQSVRLEQWRKALQDFPLRRFVEINHHITSKNGVKWIFKGPRVTEQIERLEPHHCGDFRPY